MTDPPPPITERDPHFIGWLPMPRTYARVRPFDGRPVRVTGTVLTRGGWRMLELAAEDGLRPVELPERELAGLRRPPPARWGG